MTTATEPRDLLDLASDIGDAQILTAAVYRALWNAYENETAPATAGAAALPDLIEARAKLDKVIAELQASAAKADGELS